MDERNVCVLVKYECEWGCGMRIRFACRLWVCGVKVLYEGLLCRCLGIKRSFGFSCGCVFWVCGDGDGADEDGVW